MQDTSVNRPDPAAAWYRNGYVWMLIAVPLSSVLVGVTMFALASASYDGLVVDDYYKRGLQINQVLSRDDAAARHGLEARLWVEAGEARLVLEARSPAFTAPQRIRVRASHATRQEHDRVFELLATGPGVYQGRFPPLVRGRWYLELAAADWRLGAVTATPFTALAFVAAPPRP